jgi:hypothetical protein
VHCSGYATSITLSANTVTLVCWSRNVKWKHLSEGLSRNAEREKQKTFRLGLTCCVSQTGFEALSAEAKEHQSDGDHELHSCNGV